MNVSNVGCTNIDGIILTQFQLTDYLKRKKQIDA